MIRRLLARAYWLCSRWTLSTEPAPTRPTVLIGNQRSSRVNDKATCGAPQDKVAVGEPSVLVAAVRVRRAPAPDEGLDADSQVVSPLRKGIHRELGFHTLSLQMPVLPGRITQEHFLAYAETFPDAYARIQAAIDFLHSDEGQILLATGSTWAQNFPITPGQRATAEQVAKAGIPEGELLPNAPEQYTVKTGDTLWAISGLYLKSPWRWPDLWGMNMQDIANPQALALQTTVNGKVTQSGNTRDMIFDVPFLVEYFSSFMTLQPGDLILTGTPDGVVDCQPGDVVVTSIEGVGELINTIE